MPSLQQECAAPFHASSLQFPKDHHLLVPSAEASPMYYALYLLPQKFSGILPAMQLAVASRAKCMLVNMNVICGRNKMVVSTFSSLTSSSPPSQTCCVTLDDLASVVSASAALQDLCELDIEAFPAALLLSSRHFAMLTLLASAADAALHTGAFGMRWQCWTTMEHFQPPHDPLPLASLRFAQFCSTTFPPYSSSFSTCPVPLSLALQMDWHESVVGGLSKRALFQVLRTISLVEKRESHARSNACSCLLQTRACVFVSRAFGDGTGMIGTECVSWLFLLSMCGMVDCRYRWFCEEASAMHGGLSVCACVCVVCVCEHCPMHRNVCSRASTSTMIQATIYSTKTPKGSTPVYNIASHLQPSHPPMFLIPSSLSFPSSSESSAHLASLSLHSRPITSPCRIA